MKKLLFIPLLTLLLSSCVYIEDDNCRRQRVCYEVELVDIYGNVYYENDCYWETFCDY